MPNACRKRRRLLASRDLLLALIPALVLAAVLWQVLPVTASSSPRPWDKGVVRYYDGSGRARTGAPAAARWNQSGAHVRLEETRSAKDADVVVQSDDRWLFRLCGR